MVVNRTFFGRPWTLSCSHRAPDVGQSSQVKSRQDQVDVDRFQTWSAESVRQRSRADCWHRRNHGIQCGTSSWCVIDTWSSPRKTCKLSQRQSTATLVHAFVTSRVDYWCCLLANAPQLWTDKLQRVLNAAARIITNTGKYDRRLSNIMRNDLHWLNIPQRIVYRRCVMVYKCLHGLAPPYLADLCCLVSGTEGRRQLRSAAHGDLVVPRFKLSTYGKRAFSYAGPATWNTLPINLKDMTLTFGSFCGSLKTYLFSGHDIHGPH